MRSMMVVLLALAGCAEGFEPRGVLMVDVCDSVRDQEIDRLQQAALDVELVTGCYVPPIARGTHDRCDAAPTRNKVQIRACDDVVAPYFEGCWNDGDPQAVQWATDDRLDGSGVAFWGGRGPGELVLEIAGIDDWDVRCVE